MSKFQPAKKSASKLRCALAGPSGSGKTMTALRIAKGIADAIQSKIAVIDSEHLSASKYADRFQFDTVEPFDHAIETYIELIRDAGKAGYGVLVIDGLTQAWQELCQTVEKIAQTKFKGNTWSAWSEGTPMQRKLVEAILSYPGHVIATMRVDTEWTVNEQRRPVKVGLKPSQGKGIEYEFDMLITLSPDHMATVEKDRTSKFQDKIVDKPGEAFGAELVAWLNSGESPTPAAPTPAPAKTEPKATPAQESSNEGQRKFAVGKLDLVIRTHRMTDDVVGAFIAAATDGQPLDALSKDDADTVLPRLESIGRLYTLINEKNLSYPTVAKALAKFDKKNIGELTTEESEKIADGIRKMSSRAA